METRGLCSAREKNNGKTISVGSAQVNLVANNNESVEYVTWLTQEWREQTMKTETKRHITNDRKYKTCKTLQYMCNQVAGAVCE